jgi:DUF1009 family protein
MVAPKLGIIAGGGTLPARLANTCRETGRDYLLLALEGHADADILASLPYEWIRPGAAGQTIKKLRTEGVEELVLAGPVRRPSFKEIRPDGWGIRFLAKIGRAWAGDDSFLSALVNALEEEGFKVVGADAVLNDCLSVSGLYGSIAPDETALLDIERGLEVVRTLGKLDIGQAAVIQQGVVLGVEGAEGTDHLIERCANLQLSGNGAILVKARKPQQERRVDLPTIGRETVEKAIQGKFSGIAIEAGGALVFDKEEFIQRANEANLFVIGV